MYVDDMQTLRFGESCSLVTNKQNNTMGMHICVFVYVCHKIMFICSRMYVYMLSFYEFCVCTNSSRVCKSTGMYVFVYVCTHVDDISFVHLIHTYIHTYIQAAV